MFYTIYPLELVWEEAAAEPPGSELQVEGGPWWRPRSRGPADGGAPSLHRSQRLLGSPPAAGG